MWNDTEFLFVSTIEAADAIDVNRSTITKLINKKRLRAIRDDESDRDNLGYAGPLRWNVELKSLLQYCGWGTLALNRINWLEAHSDALRTAYAETCAKLIQEQSNYKQLGEQYCVAREERGKLTDQNALLSADKKFLISENSKYALGIGERNAKINDLEFAIEQLDETLCSVRNQLHNRIEKTEEITGQFHERGHIIERLTDRCTVLQTRIDIISRRSRWKRLLGIR